VAEFFDHIPENLQAFIARQKVFFVATAASTGRISLSPKGMDSFRCLGPNRAAYLDLTGSGNETAAYLKADGRVTLMWCSFDHQALILRLYGTGRAVQRGAQEWRELIGNFPDFPGARQIMLFDIGSVQTSCGYAVPRYELIGERDILLKWADNKSPEGVRAYQEQKNRISIDGFDTGLGEITVQDNKN
jgi:hypothetical protein